MNGFLWLLCCSVAEAQPTGGAAQPSGSSGGSEGAPTILSSLDGLHVALFGMLLVTITVAAGLWHSLRVAQAHADGYQEGVRSWSNGSLGGGHPADGVRWCTCGCLLGASVCSLRASAPEFFPGAAAPWRCNAAAPPELPRARGWSTCFELGMAWLIVGLFYVGMLFMHIVGYILSPSLRRTPTPTRRISLACDAPHRIQDTVVRRPSPIGKARPPPSHGCDAQWPPGLDDVWSRDDTCSNSSGSYDSVFSFDPCYYGVRPARDEADGCQFLEAAAAAAAPDESSESSESDDDSSVFAFSDEER